MASGCTPTSGPRPSAASCAPRCRRVRPRRRRGYRDRPDAGVQAAIGTCSPRSPLRVGLRGRRRVRRPPVPAARLRRRVGRAAALGHAHHARVIGILKNPGYAGAYVHGRYSSRRTVEPDGTVRTALVERPRAEWPVLIKDHHEGYSPGPATSPARRSWRPTAPTPGRPPREGSALCQGIIACGSCGKPMRTNYHTGQRPAYECSSRADRLTTPTCRSVAAATVDDAVAGVLLDALTAEQVALALAAADEVAAGTSGSAGPPSSPSNAPATTPTGPSAPSAPASRKTGWSPAAWKRAGKPGSPPSPRPSRPWKPPANRCRRCLAGLNWRNSPPTCQGCGTPRPPAARTASGCCAP